LKDDNESIAGSIGSSLDMMDSVASLDGSVRAIEDGVNHMEIVDEEDEVAAKIAKGEQLPPEICLFCLYPSSTLEENVSHMSLAHGLFIPEKEYLTDLRGLIVYLNEKVGVGNSCLYCSKTFTSAEGARAHMVLLSQISLIIDRQRSL
jgi:pre-60S factor REI1